MNVLGKLIIAQFVKKFPAFYATWILLTMLTTALHSLLSGARWNQCTPSHHTLTLDHSNRRKYRLIYKFIHFDLQDILESNQLYLKYEIVFNYKYLVISKYRRPKDGIENFASELTQWKKLVSSKYFPLSVRFLRNSMTQFGKDSSRCS
jgi:hypothetical protein